jgi:hypothetical protein
MYRIAEQIVVPSWIVLSKSNFCECKSLESVRFESGSRLERIDESMFEGSRVSFCSVSAGQEKQSGGVCRAK